MERNGDGGQPDLDKITDTLEPDNTEFGGLFVPGKDRIVFRPSEKKSILGLDVLASKKREELSMKGAIKVPKNRVASIAASLDEEEEMSIRSGIDEVENNMSNDAHKFSNRRYRELATIETYDSGSVVTEEIRGNKMHVHHGADNHMKEDLTGMMDDGNGKITSSQWLYF